MGGGYEELFVEDSTASCEAGPHNHQGEEPEKPEGEDEEMIRMEIMLGMAQEEGIPCLQDLCVLPRCICHVTNELTKLELKLRKLEAGQLHGDEEEEQVTKDDQEEEGKKREKADDQTKSANNKEVVEKGTLGGPLRSEGLTSYEEGSFPPQGPAGVPGSPISKNPEAKKEETSQKEETSHQSSQEARHKEANKVKCNNLLLKMREGQKQAGRQQEDKKQKRAAAKQKREEAKRKEAQELTNSQKSLTQMMNHWRTLEEDRKKEGKPSPSSLPPPPSPYTYIN